MKEKIRDLISVLAIVLMVLSVLPNRAFAESGDGVVIITTGDEKQIQEKGDVTTTKYEDDAVYLESYENSSIDLTTGNLEATGEKADGIYAYAKNNSSITINVKNVETKNDDGIEVETNDNATVNVTAENVTSGDDAVIAFAYGGNVSVSTKEINGGYYGISTDSDDDGLITITTKGDVNALKNGMDLETEDESKAVIVVDGNVISSSDDGIYSNTEDDGEVNVTVSGDVIGKNNGVYIDSRDNSKNTINAGSISGDVGVNLVVYDSSSVDITSDEINGDSVSIRLSDGPNTDNVTVTAWKIAVNGSGNVAEDDSGEPAETFEKNNISYIIKLEQPTAGATLSALNADGEAINSAKQDERVLLKVNVESGYKLKGAYNGKGEKQTLLVDENGNYYVEVPKGGAVYLSVDLEKEVTPEPEKDTDDTQIVEPVHRIPHTGVDRMVEPQNTVNHHSYNGFMITAALATTLLIIRKRR